MIIKILIAVGIVLVLWVIYSYNILIRWKFRVKNAWSQIDVQLKRRYDLIPNLVESVKGYMEYEKELLEKITELRAMAIKARNLKERGKAEGELSENISRLLAVAEKYPDLKANKNFLMLQEELVSTENRIAFARQFYNDCVMNYNTKQETFPTNIIAKLFRFKKAEFLLFPQDRGVPTVKFGG